MRNVNPISISSAVETIKELKLQKEDDSIQKMIAKMSLMKQIQRKTEENKKLEKALVKLSERRQLINKALKQQKLDADKKRENVLEILQRQKDMLTKNKLNQQRHRESIKDIPDQELFEKTEMLEAHKILVDKSNQRILDRIEEIKQSRQRGAIAEQERLVREQQAAINLIRKIQSHRKHNTRENLRKKQTKKPKLVDPILSLSEYLEKAKASLTLDPEEKKQMMEWMDLEKNAAILHKTDKAIAQKIRSASSKKNQEPDFSDKDIDHILGIGGLGDLTDLLSLNSDAQISVDSSLFEDDEELDYYQEDYDYEYDQTPEMSQPQQSNVRTQVQRLPGGRVSTKVSIGLETPRPHIPRLGPRDFNNRGQRPRSFSDLMMH